MRPNFRVDFFGQKKTMDFFCKIYPFTEKRMHFKGICFIKLKDFFLRGFPVKIEGDINFLVTFFFVGPIQF